MDLARSIVKALLWPPRWVLACVPTVSFCALVLVFALGEKETPIACLVYLTSAYSLVVLLVHAPSLFKAGKDRASNSGPMQWVMRNPLLGRYFGDLEFRGGVSIVLSGAVNLFNVVFRLVAGVRYASAWFISLAVYYLVLLILRVYLLACYRKRDPGLEWDCYRRVAKMLFLLNIPMGGMIVLTVRTNAGFSYSGYVIYLSALYTVYASGSSIANLVRYRKVGSPVLSAAKALGFVSALMSVLGLQTAMIASFSTHGEGYRVMMNAITGGCVFAAVVAIAIYMLVRGSCSRDGEGGHDRARTE